MNTVITTVGTSLFTNYCYENEKSSVCHFCEDKNIRYSDWENYKDNIEKVKKLVLKWSRGNKDASAEIKSLRHLQAKKGNLCVHFITTDTIQSYLAAEIIVESLQHENISFHQEIHRIEGLQVENADEFKRTGMPNLMKKLKDLKKKDCILNISGGYKALIPYLTIMGQLFDMDLYYIYEDSDELIKIQALPFNLDWVFAEKVYEPMHSDNLFELDKNSEVFTELLQYSLIDPETGKRTPLGEIIKDYISKEYYFSRQALGHFMEYKIFEHYIEESYEASGKKYSNVKRSLDIKSNDKESEIDVVLSTGNELEGYFIAIESKLYSRLAEKKEKECLETKIFKKVEILSELDKIPDEFHLCVFCTSNSQNLSLFKDRFALISQSIKERFPHCLFKVFEVKFITKYMGENGYQSLSKEKLDKDAFKLYETF